jgi:hypothetical protein
MPLSAHVDLEALRRDRRVGFYFRYPLHRRDFWPIRVRGRLLGYATAKPLYAGLTTEGRVDRASGYDGRIAVLFLPSPVRSGHRARVLFARMPANEIVRTDGCRDWSAIRAAAERAVRRQYA